MRESEYVSLIRERYEPEGDMEYEDEADLLLLLNGPEAYENEDQMLNFAKEHPDATMKDLIEYWDSITPDGLPPGMTEEDLLDDEDD